MNEYYARLIKHMQHQGAKCNPPSIDIGIVISDDPLVIKIGDLQLSKGNLLIADYLLKDYKRKFKIDTTAATGTAGEHSISSIGISNGIIDFTEGLKKDDLVCLISTNDKQTYIILCRVVKP